MASQRTKMRSSADVAKRIMWDAAIPSEHFVVGYIDRFVGIQERAFDEFNWGDLATLSHTELAIPHHRIQYFKYKGKVVWDKRSESRFDSFFGSFTAIGSLPRKIEDLLIQDPPEVKELEEKENIEQPEGQSCSSYKQDSCRRTPSQELRPNYFISCRVLSDRIERAVEAIQNSDPVFQEGALPLAHLHFTILTLRLEDSRQVQRATQALESFDLESIEGFDLPFELDAPQLFSNRVLYAELSPESAVRMIRLHDCLRTHMIDSLGLSSVLLGPSRAFMPHMTISKKSRAMSRERKVMHNAMCSQYRRALNQTKFRARALHLCPMGKPKDRSDFYQLIASRFSQSALACHQLGMRILEASGDRSLVVEKESAACSLNRELHMAALSKHLRSRNMVVSRKDSACDRAWKLIIIRGIDTFEKRAFVKERFLSATATGTSNLNEPSARLVEITPRNATDAMLRALSFFSHNFDCIRAQCDSQAHARDVVLVSVFSTKKEYELYCRLAQHCGAFKVEIIQFDSSTRTLETLDSDFFARREHLGSWESDERAVVETALPTQKTLGCTDLLVLDLDKTLLMTADPPNGWDSSHAWVRHPRSIDESLDDIVYPGPALDWFWRRTNATHINEFVVILSGRSELLRSEIESLLDRWAIKVDCLILKNSTDPTSTFKAKALETLAKSLCFSSCTCVDDDEKCRTEMEKHAGELWDSFSCLDPGKLKAMKVGMSSRVDEQAIENGHREAFRWVASQFAHLHYDHPRKRNGLIEEEALLLMENPGLSILPFGSAFYGRRRAFGRTDLDLCVLSPRDLMDQFYEKVRSSTQSTKQLEETGLLRLCVLQSHYSKRARCPRISLKIKIEPGSVNEAIEMDVDIVMAVLPPTVFSMFIRQRHDEDKENASHPFQLQELNVPSSRSLTTLTQACADEKSKKSLSGPLLVSRIRETLPRFSIDLADFGSLVDQVSDHLDALSLRFQEFQGLKTFQIALLVEKYIKSPEFHGELKFESFCQYVGWGMDPKCFINIMQGIYHDNRDSFSTCNLAHRTRLLEAFRNRHVRSFDFNKERAGARVYRCSIRSLKLWKTKILLSAGFPAVVRQIQQYSTGSYFVGNFVRVDNEEETIVVEFAASFSRGLAKTNSVQERELITRSFSLLVLPQGTQLELLEQTKEGHLNEIIMEKTFQ